MDTDARGQGAVPPEGDDDNRRLVEEALRVYQARRERREHPKGTFDNGGRWYPAGDEQQPCCSGIRTPSRAHPYSLMVHCRTMIHVANIFGITPEEMKWIASGKRTINPIKYKMVALMDDGRLEEVFDAFVASEAGPNSASLAEWIHRYPEYARELTEFAASWSLMKWLPPSPDAEEVDEETLVLRGMSVVQNLLHRQEQEQAAATAWERPRIQVVARNADYEQARSKAQSAYDALVAVKNQDLSGTRYLVIRPLQTPFSLGRDANDRALVACNYELERRP